MPEYCPYWNEEDILKSCTDYVRLNFHKGAIPEVDSMWCHGVCPYSRSTKYNFKRNTNCVYVTKKLSESIKSILE